MSRHATPSAPHRCQCRVRSAGPLHEPSSAVSDPPTAAVPVTVGVPSEVGGCSVAGSAAATTAVGSDAERPVPYASEALTTTRSVEPASSAPTTYVALIAPAMSRHASPAAEHRCHCRCRATAPLPDQTPSPALSLPPTAAVPVMLGGTTTATGTICGAGAGASTAAVGADVDVAVPSAFVPVTTTTSVEPTSPDVTS